MSLYQRKNYQRNRQYIDEKKSVPCTDCGGTFPLECMDFDHVRGEKKYNIGSLIGCAKARIDEELAKCEVVCANCHRIRTKNRGQYMTERTDLYTANEK